jgi:hypothetical protein
MGGSFCPNPMCVDKKARIMTKICFIFDIESILVNFG